MLRTFEDFPVGWTETCGPTAPIAKDEIVAFAREFDAQPFHVDEVAAKETFVGTLIASGWHTCALNMRLVADGFLNGAMSMGSPGLEEVKWLVPVRPGDSLRSRATVIDARPSQSRPSVGLVRFHFDVLNQREETVITQDNWIMLGRRGHPWPPQAGELKKPSVSPPPPRHDDAQERGDVSPDVAPYLDDVVVGTVEELGSFTFTAEDIVRFAKQFDPQPFHVDPIAAKESLFGGLCASGWHTAAVWMKLRLLEGDRTWGELVRRGHRVPRLGPSPGFKNMKWTRPVYAGDTITYRSTVTGTRPSASRPQWGLVFHRNRGVNQHGDEVISFDGAVFWERRIG